MDELERLIIERSCERLMSLYCTHIDRLDADAFASLFAVDGRYHPAAQLEPLVGRAAIREWAAAYPRNRLSLHVSTNQIVDVVDQNHATGSSYAIVWRQSDPRAGEISANVTPRSLVEYTDQFTRTGEGWRFSHRSYSILFLEAGESHRPSRPPRPLA